jgi:hypothetical protein
MPWLASFLLFVLTIAVVVLGWWALLGVVSSWFGVHLKVFRWWRRGKEITPLRIGEYVILRGVLGWGWGCFLAKHLYAYLSHSLLGRPLRPISATDMLFELLIWSAGGVLFGYSTYKRACGSATTGM